jgi:hypothetical protein
VKLDPCSLEVGPKLRASCVSFESHFPIQETAVLLNETGAESLGHLTIRLSCPASHCGGAGDKLKEDLPDDLEHQLKQKFKDEFSVSLMD